MKSVLKYKILIQLLVLNCVLMCCAYSDTVRTEGMMLCLQVTIYVYIPSNVSSKERLPEEGHNMWPKHVAGYAVCNAINLLVCISPG
jgi:hypothetical protein